MNERATQNLAHTLEVLGDTQPSLGRAIANLETWAANGYPNGTGTLGTTTHSITETRALTPDPTAQNANAQLGALHDHLRQLRRTADTIARLVTSATTTTTKPGAEGCKYCAQVHHPNNWQPIYSRGMCSWHYDGFTKYGIAYHTTIVQWHLDHPGATIPRTLIRDYHPTEYDEHHRRP